MLGPPNAFREEPSYVSQLRLTDDKSICSRNPTCSSFRIVVPLMVQLEQDLSVTVDLVIHVFRKFCESDVMQFQPEWYDHSPAEMVEQH